LPKVGFTTTIPLEILIAAAKVPVDLNNIFISSNRSSQLIEDAEISGFPRNVCGWIKGIYSAIIENDIREMIAVTEGDCSYTKALMEVLANDGVEVVPFAYPLNRSYDAIRIEIEKLMNYFAVDWSDVNIAKERLDKIRLKVHEIDRLSWQENLVTGEENHYFQVSTSDMNSDLKLFESEVDSFLQQVSNRTPMTNQIRLAFIGVPPIVSELYSFIESRGGRVVFNETQRQFTMPYGYDDLTEQYRAYTYPYDIFHRIGDIRKEIAQRDVVGVIHYVQSFCFRQIEDIVIRREIPYPILTLEGDKPSPLDARSKIRIEGFLEMLEENRSLPKE
jgi:benzoyl-CoA reductase/2-hydroxyglutaryl-CoA dehydratase subunit BcrC/BadD/HgdB